MIQLEMPLHREHQTWQKELPTLTNDRNLSYFSTRTTYLPDWHLARFFFFFFASSTSEPQYVIKV